VAPIQANWLGPLIIQHVVGSYFNFLKGHSYLIVYLQSNYEKIISKECPYI